MTVQSFDSFEEAQAAMAANEDRANAGLHPLQIALRDDIDTPRYFAGVAPDCLFFGHAYSRAEVYAAAAKYVSEVGADDYEESLDEALYEIAVCLETRPRGYLRGIHFTLFDPEGDFHDVHVSEAWPISAEAFEEAKAAGWRAVQVVDAPNDEVARQHGGTPTLLRELDALNEAMHQ